jgi:hypothetical protein
MEVVMERRFFVTIFAPDQSALADLGKYGLDLFPASRRGRVEISVGGLLGEASIKKVRRAGYRVEVLEEYIEQARRTAGHAPPVEVMDAREWLESFNRRK